MTYEARKAKLQKLIGKIPKPPGFKVWVSASNLGKNTGKAINIADYNDFRPVSDLITGYGEHSKGSPKLVQKAGSPHYEDSKLFKVSVYNDYIIESNNEWFMVQISGGYGKKFDPIIGWSVYVKDATELPGVPLDFKFSKSQKELLAVISRNADLNEGHLEN